MTDRPFKPGIPSRCRSCHAPIRWIKMSTSATPNPINAEPSVDGTIRIEDNGRGTVLSPAGLVDARQAGETLWVAHWSVCPDRVEWARRSGRSVAA
jgi:hypothetical protein